MDRYYFLMDSDVEGFRRWAGNLTAGRWKLRQEWSEGSPLYDQDSVTMHGAYADYKWNGASFTDNEKTLAGFRARVRDAMRAGPTSAAARQGFLSAAQDMVEWGRIWKHERLDDLGDNALESMLGHAALLNPNTATMSGLSGFDLMGSGFSKVYSLMLDDFPIYDSRVGCALTSLIILFCEDTGRLTVPSVLKLGVPVPLGGRGVNPSRGRLGVGDIRYSQQALYARSNVKAAWLLQRLASSVPGEFSAVPVAQRVRAMEAALFMLGYEPLREGSVLKP